MTSIDYKFWWDVLLTLVTGGMGLVLWLRQPGEDAKAAMPALVV